MTELQLNKQAWRRDDVAWYTPTPQQLQRAPSGLVEWLVSKESLTQRLIDASDMPFSVRLLRQAIELPLASEACALGLPRGRAAFVRQVQLLCGDVPVVYARTVIPIEIAHRRLRGLTRLGTRPLGAVLFSNPTMHRGQIEIAHIDEDHGLNHLAHQATSAQSQPIWGRRSLFYLYNQPLLVSEIFLASFPFGHDH